jgi:6,7-dimethyl-8-ribityllumazine synthase
MLRESNKAEKFEGPARLAIVAAKYNFEITSSLEKGARRVIAEAGLSDQSVETFWVPGAVEIPLIAKLLAESGKYDAIVCLAAVIKGETKHDFFIGKIVTDGVRQVSLQFALPVMFGVLTCENLEQAQARAGSDNKNRGYEAARSALKMVGLVRKIKNDNNA